MNVEKIMVKHVITVDADVKVKEAAKLMNKYNIGCLIVEYNGKVAGIVTERDLLKRVIEESMDPERVNVSEIMSQPLIAGSPTMNIEDVVRHMFKYKIKKLPILEEDHLVGLVTLTDIIRVVDVESLIAKIVEEFRKDGWSPPDGMKKVIDHYIA
jgi:CBS domain-containing protein